MTLEEAAEGICSISYFSKVENNLIELSGRYIEPIINRLDLHAYKESNRQLYETTREKMITSLVNCTKNIASDVLEPFMNRSDHQAHIIFLGYYLLYENYPNAYTHYQKLIQIIPQLDEEEMTILALFISSYLRKSKNDQEAYKILSALPKSDNLKLNFIIKRELYHCAVTTNKIMAVEKLYPELNKIAFDLKEFNQIIEFQYQYLIYQSALIHIKDIIDEINNNQILNETKKKNILAHAYYHNSDYKQVINLLNLEWRKNEESLILYLIALDKLNEKKRINYILHEIDKFELNHNAKLIKEYLSHKINDSKDEIIEYIRILFFENKAVTDAFYLVEYLFYDSSRILSSYHFYKETVEILKKLRLKCNELQKCLDHQLGNKY